MGVAGWGAPGEGPEARPGPSLGALSIEAVGVGGLAMCITLMFLGMRSVMAVGGSCADGGPYVSAQSCPDGSGAALTLGMLGLFAFGALTLVAGSRVGGIWAASPLFAWAGLFLSLGWNFLDAGLLHADPQAGPEPGALICGVLFVVMGASPLVAMALMGVAQVNHAWGFDPAVGMGRASSSWRRTRRGDLPETSTPWLGQRDATSFETSGSSEPGQRQPLDDEAVAHIERLSDLHTRGELTDAEYRAALGAAIRDGRGDKA